MSLDINKKYTLVGIDIDTTGRRLVDEIIQISAYNPKSKFSQYVMPYMNLNPAAKKRHQLGIITIGFFRMLKCTRTNKILKAKSEIAALKDFLNWLEVLVKTDANSDGVILIYHEQRKFLPFMLIEAFKKYNLLDAFLEIVKFSINGYDFAKERCQKKIKSYTLRSLSKSLLNIKEFVSYFNYRNFSGNKYNDNNNLLFEGDASVRSKLAFDIFQQIAKICLNNECGDNQSDLKVSNDTLIVDNIEITFRIVSELIKDILNPISVDIEALIQEKINLERQNSFRPILAHYFEATLYYRVRAVKYRIILSANGYDYEVLKKIWIEKKKEGLEEKIKMISDLKENERIEIIDLLDCHFDPAKTPKNLNSNIEGRPPPTRRYKTHFKKEKINETKALNDDKIKTEIQNAEKNVAIKE